MPGVVVISLPDVPADSSICAPGAGDATTPCPAFARRPGVHPAVGGTIATLSPSSAEFALSTEFTLSGGVDQGNPTDYNETQRGGGERPPTSARKLSNPSAPRHRSQTVNPTALPSANDHRFRGSDPSSRATICRL